MAKVRRYRLSWKPPGSNLVIGYRLYWSKGESVNYDSNFIELGNVTEVYLPDVLNFDPRYEICAMLGITALESHGNESDMVILPAPCQITAPSAPKRLLLVTLDEFTVVGPDKELSNQSDTMLEDDIRKEDLE